MLPLGWDDLLSLFLCLCQLLLSLSECVLHELSHQQLGGVLNRIQGSTVFWRRMLNSPEQCRMAIDGWRGRLH